MATVMFLAGRVTTDGGMTDSYPDYVFNTYELAKEYIDQIELGGVWLHPDDRLWLKISQPFDITDYEDGWYEGFYIKMEIVQFSPM